MKIEMRKIICCKLIFCLIFGIFSPCCAQSIDEKSKNIEYEKLKLGIAKKEHKITYSQPYSFTWRIIQGENTYLTDEKFLELIGDSLALKTVREKITQDRGMGVVGIVLTGAGVLLLFNVGGWGDFATPILGTGALVFGISLFAIGFRPEVRYIDFKYAQEKIDEYNKNLQIKLGISF